MIIVTYTMKSKLLKIEDNSLIFRNHPIYIFNGLITFIIFIFTILFTIFKEFIRKNNNIYNFFSETRENIKSIHVNLFFFIAITFFFMLILFIIFRYYLLWKNTTIKVNNTIIVSKKYGMFFKKDKNTFIKNISNINLNSGILLGLLRVKKVSIDINSSETANKEDYTIYLPNDLAITFKNTIYKLQNNINIKYIIDEYISKTDKDLNDSLDGEIERKIH